MSVTPGHRLRVVILGQRMIIHDAEDATVPVLQHDPVAYSNQVVPEAKLAGRLHRRKHRFHRVSVYLPLELPSTTERGERAVRRRISTGFVEEVMQMRLL